MGIETANPEQIQSWDGPAGIVWSRFARIFDGTMVGYHQRLMDACQIAPDARVLDIACGNGLTTRDAARLASNGSVLGVDLSSQMLAYAQHTTQAEGLTNVEFAQLDAQIHPFPPASFDVALSRNGTMFFADPVAAFTNIAAALRPGARFVQLVWQSPDENEWFADFGIALAAGREVPVFPPDGPSPFALANPDRVRRLLGDAGFEVLAIDGFAEPMCYGSTVDEAFEMVTALQAWRLEGLDEAGVARALAALRTNMQQHLGRGGVCYRSAAWLIAARRP